MHTALADTTFCFSIHPQSHRAPHTQMLCSYYRSLVLHWCRSTGAENKLGQDLEGGDSTHQSITWKQRSATAYTARSTAKCILTPTLPESP